MESKRIIWPARPKLFTRLTGYTGISARDIVQGSQFTSGAYTGLLKSHGIAISMDGRGRCFDNIFTERLWRTVKYEEVYLQRYESLQHAKESLTRYFRLYNTIRLHTSLNDKTPAEIYFGGGLNPHLKGGENPIYP